MKQELYHYATCLQPKIQNAQNIPNACIYILLTIFSLPLLFTNFFLWAILFVSYVAFALYNKKEKNQYIKTLFQIGTFIAYLGIEISCLLIQTYSVCIPLLCTLGIALLFYEMVFLLNIKQKRYSQKSSAAKNSTGKAITALAVLGSISSGRLISRLFKDTPIPLWIAVLVSALIIVGSITYLQKSIIGKILKI